MVKITPPQVPTSWLKISSPSKTSDSPSLVEGILPIPHPLTLFGKLCWVQKRQAVLNKGRLIDTPDFNCHNCLHPSESEKKAHKFKLRDCDCKRVNKFCYIGDILSAAGGAEASSITIITTSWKTFRELMQLLTLRVSSHKMNHHSRKLVSGVLCYTTVKHGRLT